MPIIKHPFDPVNQRLVNHLNKSLSNYHFTPLKLTNRKPSKQDQRLFRFKGMELDRYVLCVEKKHRKPKAESTSVHITSELILKKKVFPTPLEESDIILSISANFLVANASSKMQKEVNKCLSNISIINTLTLIVKKNTTIGLTLGRRRTSDATITLKKHAPELLKRNLPWPQISAHEKASARIVNKGDGSLLSTLVLIHAQLIEVSALKITLDKNQFLSMPMFDFFSSKEEHTAEPVSKSGRSTALWLAKSLFDRFGTLTKTSYKAPEKVLGFLSQKHNCKNCQALTITFFKEIQVNLGRYASTLQINETNKRLNEQLSGTRSNKLARNPATPYSNATKTSSSQTLRSPPSNRELANQIELLKSQRTTENEGKLIKMLIEFKISVGESLRQLQAPTNGPSANDSFALNSSFYELADSMLEVLSPKKNPPKSGDGLRVSTLRKTTRENPRKLQHQPANGQSANDSFALNSSFNDLADSMLEVLSPKKNTAKSKDDLRVSAPRQATLFSTNSIILGSNPNSLKHSMMVVEGLPDDDLDTSNLLSSLTPFKG